MCEKNSGWLKMKSRTENSSGGPRTEIDSDELGMENYRNRLQT